MNSECLNMFPITRKIKKKGRTYEYVQIIENYRKEGKIKQRLVMTLGRKDAIDMKEIGITRIISGAIQSIRV